MNEATPIFDVPLDIEKLVGFTPFVRPLADGMRASTLAVCPACAIIETLTPNDPRVFDTFLIGVGTLGHLLQQAYMFQSFEGRATYHHESPVPWPHGISHDDGIVLDGPYVGLDECKTHSDHKAKNPSSANIRQTKLRRRLRELGNLPLPGPSRIVMIGKAGNEGGMIRLGATIEDLTDEERAEFDELLDRVDSVMARAAELDLSVAPVFHELVDTDLRALANGCTRCAPKPKMTADSSLDDLMSAASAVKEQIETADEFRKQAAADVKASKEEYARLRGLIDPYVPDTHVVVGTNAKASKRRDGALLINAG